MQPVVLRSPTALPGVPGPSAPATGTSLYAPFPQTRVAQPVPVQQPPTTQQARVPGNPPAQGPVNRVPANPVPANPVRANPVPTNPVPTNPVPANPVPAAPVGNVGAAPGPQQAADDAEDIYANDPNAPQGPSPARPARARGPVRQPAQGGAPQSVAPNAVPAPAPQQLAPAPQQVAPAPLPIAAVRPAPPSLHLDPRYINENRTRDEVARYQQPQPSREAFKARDKIETDIASEQRYLSALVQNMATASPLARQTYQQNIAASSAEIDRLRKKIVDLGLTGTSAQLEAYTVRYLNTPQERAAYRVTPGPAFLSATSKQQLDTSKFNSYGSGSGFGAFVLSPTGELYVGEHRIQRFHHSSFLAGGEVAAAGEMKIVNGKLTELTNKSGHYKPTPAHTLALLDQLARNKVPLAGVRLGLVDPASAVPNAITWIEDAEQWRRQQHQQLPGAVAQ